MEMDEGGGGPGGGAQQAGAGEASEGHEGRGWSGHGSTPRGNPVCSGGADLDYAADVGDPHCHGVRAAAPEALHRIRIRLRILGTIRRVVRGAGEWAGGGARRRGGAWSSGGGKRRRGGDKGVGEYII